MKTFKFQPKTKLNSKAKEGNSKSNIEKLSPKTTNEITNKNNNNNNVYVFKSSKANNEIIGNKSKPLEIKTNGNDVIEEENNKNENFKRSKTNVISDLNNINNRSDDNNLNRNNTLDNKDLNKPL